MADEIEYQIAIKAAKSLTKHTAVSRETWTHIDMEEDSASARWLAFQARSDARAKACHASR